MWQVWVKRDGKWELSNEHVLEQKAQEEAVFWLTQGYQATCTWVD